MPQGFRNPVLQCLIIALLLICCIQFPAFSATGKKDAYRGFTSENIRLDPPANRPIDFTEINYSLLQASVFFETNRVRAEHGLPRLLPSDGLEKAAVMHSNDMVRKGFFGHENPYDPEKSSLARRMVRCGIRFGRCAENIADVFGIKYAGGSPVIPPTDGRKRLTDISGRVIPNHTYNSFAEMVVRQWMNSDGHRANILDAGMKYLGVGACHYRDKKFYDVDRLMVTQVFSDRRR